MLGYEPNRLCIHLALVKEVSASVIVHILVMCGKNRIGSFLQPAVHSCHDKVRQAAELRSRACVAVLFLHLLQ
jgi:hypothetical protein